MVNEAEFQSERFLYQFTVGAPRHAETSGLWLVQMVTRKCKGVRPPHRQMFTRRPLAIAPVSLGKLAEVGTGIGNIDRLSLTRQIVYLITS